MFKKPTQDLIEEHHGIQLMLRIMEQVGNKLETGEEINRDHLNKILEFLKNFVDKCHHGKEEGILFPYLAQDSSNQLLLNQLSGEHQSGRDLVRGISESLEKIAKNNADAFHIAINIREYILLLNEHIKKENLLFEKQEKIIPEQDQMEIEERFEKLEEEIIGIGKHEEYHGWLKELKTFYLTTDNTKTHEHI